MFIFLKVYTNAAIGEIRRDSLERRAFGSHGTNLLDDLELGWVLCERFAIGGQVETVGNGPDSLTVRPFDGHGRSSAFSRQVSFHLGRAGQNDQHESPGGACGVNGVTAQIYDVQSRALPFPLFGGKETVAGVSEHSV